MHRLYRRGTGIVTQRSLKETRPRGGFCFYGLTTDPKVLYSLEKTIPREKMSSTNRNKKTLEQRKEENDHFVTPQWAVSEFLRDWNRDTGVMENMQTMKNLRGTHRGKMPGTSQSLILDPCAGGDAAYPDMTYPYILENDWGFTHGDDLITIDVRPDSSAMVTADYLKWQPEFSPDLIITNPPFYCALEIIEKALTDVKMYGFVVMLLRLNFYGSQKRAPWFKEHMPLLAYVHSKRMGFYPDRPRKTDSIEYMHAIWQRGMKPDHTELRVIRSK